MGARSTYPTREAFNLDANTKIETTTKDPGFDLGTVKTIRLVVLDATVVQAAGGGTDATIELQDTDNGNATFHTITSADLANLDDNGVYIDHIRGSLWDGIRNVRYVYTAGVAGGGTAGAISGFSVYIDSVETNAAG